MFASSVMVGSCVMVSVDVLVVWWRFVGWGVFDGIVIVPIFDETVIVGVVVDMFCSVGETRVSKAERWLQAVINVATKIVESKNVLLTNDFINHSSLVPNVKLTCLWNRGTRSTVITCRLPIEPRTTGGDVKWIITRNCDEHRVGILHLPRSRTMELSARSSLEPTLFPRAKLASRC